MVRGAQTRRPGTSARRVPFRFSLSFRGAKGTRARSSRRPTTDTGWPFRRRVWHPAPPPSVPSRNSGVRAHARRPAWTARRRRTSFRRPSQTCLFHAHAIANDPTATNVDAVVFFPLASNPILSVLPPCRLARTDCRRTVWKAVRSDTRPPLPRLTRANRRRSPWTRMPAKPFFGCAPCRPTATTRRPHFGRVSILPLLFFGLFSLHKKKKEGPNACRGPNPWSSLLNHGRKPVAV